MLVSAMGVDSKKFSQNVKWVSHWLLFNANSAIFQLWPGENRLIFNEMIMRTALSYANTLSSIYIVLVHWNNSPRIDLSPHSGTLSWFRVNQSFLFLLNAACLSRNNKCQLYSLSFDPIGVRTHNLPHARRAR